MLSFFGGRVRIDGYLLALVGTVVLAAILPARGFAAVITGWAVYAAVALLFFLYGARLAPQAVVAGLTHWRLQGMVLLSTFVLFPLIGLVLAVVLRPLMPPALVTGLLYVCVLPSTVQSSIAFTSIARGNVPAALCSASVSNLIGVVLTPILTFVLLRTQGPGFSLKAIQDIATELLLPFAAGQALRPLIGRFLETHKSIIGYVDRRSILIVVYGAFSAGVVAGVWSQVAWYSVVLVVLVDALLLAAVLAATTWASRRFRFPVEDEIAVVFCGSKKSMASGLPMANILFSAATVSMVVVPLMVFHQIQLFACAALAQRYARRPQPAAVASATAARRAPGVEAPAPGR